MPIIQLPTVENPRVVLEKLLLEISAVNEELDARARVLEELLTISNEAAELQAGVATAKKTMFQLLSEQLHAAQVASVDEYGIQVQSEIKLMEDSKGRKGAP